MNLFNLNIYIFFTKISEYISINPLNLFPASYFSWTPLCFPVTETDRVFYQHQVFIHLSYFHPLLHVSSLTAPSWTWWLSAVLCCLKHATTTISTQEISEFTWRKIFNLHWGNYSTLTIAGDRNMTFHKMAESLEIRLAFDATCNSCFNLVLQVI